MKKLILILVACLVLQVQAQEKKVHKLTFSGYENGIAATATVGDTVTGVAAAAASLDTVYFGAVWDNLYAEQIMVMIHTVNVNNQDTVVVTVRPTMNGVMGTTALQTNNLVGQGGNFQLDIYPLSGNEPGIGYGLIFDGTKGADTDSTAYTIKGIYGVYLKD